ncbi:MAG: GIY-YIG nuclease family protein [Bacteroidetes bacterium]|nr:GIY-YIG nuclease family protein [Bacteroidota bacterium]
MGTHNYYTYILTNRQRSVLYIGVTNDLVGRVDKHKKGEGGVFTKRYQCHFLVYDERYQYIDHAIAREKEFKGWTRRKKDILIMEMNRDWRFLDPEVD